MCYMTRKVTDLSRDELDRLAAQAWFEASEAALKAGVPVVGRDPAQDKLIKRYPDGRIESLEEPSPRATEVADQIRSKKHAV